MRFHLPKYQITARCIRTGALFIGYTQQHSTTGTAIFIYRLFSHLKRYGVNPAEITIQTDNGTEFTAPWNSLKKHFLLRLLSFPSVLHIKQSPQGLRPIKVTWKVPIGSLRMSFMPAALFPVFKTF